MSLLDLPNELILYIFKDFLDLTDLWCLLQTNSQLRFFAVTIIQNTWKIETRSFPDTSMKIQCRSALIALESLSTQLSLSQEQKYYPPRKHFVLDPSVTLPSAIVNFLAVGSVAMNDTAFITGGGEDEEEEEEEEDLINENMLLCEEDMAIYPPELTTSNPVLKESTRNTQEKLKLFKNLIGKEERLHDRIIHGIASYRHKYVLIEDIDIRNRIRAAVDVIFHHAVFVSAISRCNNIACTVTDATTKNRALAAIMVRLLTKLDAAFPSYCREITYTLSENIKAFLEYTGYKLLSFSFQGTTTASDKKKSSSLWLTLHSISACFDLMGAAFVGKILADSHVEFAVQRTCELLIDGSLRYYKRSLLMDLLENWLTVKREMSSSELCRYIKSEIEKCDRQRIQQLGSV